MTGYYSIRLFCYTFYGELKGRRPLYFAAHESPITILYPLLFLGCGSIFFGYLTASYYSYLPTLLDQPISGGDFSYCGATSITNTVEGITDSGLVSLKNTFWDKDSRSTLMVSTYNWLVSSLVEGFYLHGLLPSSTGISTYRYTFSGGLWTFMLINLFLVFCYRQYKPYVLRTFCF
jgi:NADH:ubiquinone oxidoreductase subunit 5 (subunit L)/multisubunit Na+/H+ antiporter MnhA subunit